MLTKTTLSNGDVIFQEVEENNQPIYKRWIGRLQQAETDDVICVPNNLTDFDFLIFGNEVYNNLLVSSIGRYKNGIYSIDLPYLFYDIFVDEYKKYNNGDEVFFTIIDKGDGTSSLQISTKNINNEHSDGILNNKQFSITIRQHYES